MILKTTVLHEDGTQQEYLHIDPLPELWVRKHLMGQKFSGKRE